MVNILVHNHKIHTPMIRYLDNFLELEFLGQKGLIVSLITDSQSLHISK